MITCQEHIITPWSPNCLFVVDCRGRCSLPCERITLTSLFVRITTVPLLPFFCEQAFFCDSSSRCSSGCCQRRGAYYLIAVYVFMTNALSTMLSPQPELESSGHHVFQRLRELKIVFLYLSSWLLFSRQGTHCLSGSKVERDGEVSDTVGYATSNLMLIIQVILFNKKLDRMAHVSRGRRCPTQSCGV